MDPPPFRADSAGQNFNTGLLKIIYWMLSPYAMQTPQSAHEVLQELKNAPIHSDAVVVGRDAPQANLKQTEALSSGVDGKGNPWNSNDGPANWPCKSCWEKILAIAA